jgi:hypothetical protein
MVSFDAVPLFTKLPIQEIMDRLGCYFEEGILGLFRHVLTNSFFTFNGQFYRQTDGVAMGSPLSPIITNFDKEDYEGRRLNRPH